MKPIFTFILLILFPTLLFGAEKTLDLDAKEREALAKLASGKQGSLIRLREEDTANRFQPYLGVFISKDGLALVDLSSLARKTKPSVWLAGKDQLKFGTILGIFPKQELALMKFKHRPKEWLDLAENEPKVGDPVALVPVELENPWKGEIPPVIGPIMVKRSGMTANLRVTRFTRFLSLGASLSPIQRRSLDPGCFAINQGGKLIGFMGGTQVSRSQTLVYLNPVGHLSEQIAKLAKGGKAIPFPLPAEQNPIDLTLVDNNYRAMDLAMFQRDHVKVQHHLEMLRKRYPNNLKFKLLAAQYASTNDPNNPLLKLANLSPDPKASKAEQVKILEMRAGICSMRKDIQGAIRELEAAIQPEICPKDYPRHRSMLAVVYYQAGNLEKAEELYRQTYPFHSDSIDFVAGFQMLLLKQRKFDEAKKLGQRDAELSEIYRPR